MLIVVLVGVTVSGDAPSEGVVPPGGITRVDMPEASL